MIKFTDDYGMIRRMLTEDPEMLSRISDDHTDPSRWDPCSSEWIGWFESGRCLGLMSVSEENATVLNIHMHIPEQHRGPRSFEIGNGLIDYLIENCDNRFVKINVKIPVCFPDVIRFAEKCGFIRQGIDSRSHLKDGVHHDRQMMEKVWA